MTNPQSLTPNLQSPIAKQHLVIFTRYPEAGKTKTRLISALGSEGAAELQRQMTEHTIFQVKQLQRKFSLSFEVRFAGGNLQLVRDWLGSDIICQPQGEGDLGVRLVRSLLYAFESGAERVIIIGTDCPDLNGEILVKAFELLYHNDLVLGPAEDGGYYLIGLQHPLPDLFTNITWGTSQVLQQTIKIAQRLNLSVGYLPVLCDIDRPEDLPLWEKFISSP
ncbi:TIGR04282 family arsenosugar biosynthesis glycosyltransferase [Scytonema sp. NUACC26]|uniref:TIGR04282 family arsenosugar biosynthesis glycosyltransferase n=1 Tax=Scytonema sp. NUACC26 TaxID=3140176 RepID=UPI0034DCBE57